MIEKARQTGRTTRQLEALNDGDAYVVLNGLHVGYCRRLLHDRLKRNPDAIQIVELSRAAGFLAGRRIPATIDHACFDVRRRLDGRQIEALGWVVEYQKSMRRRP